MREIKFKFWLGHTKKMTYAHTLDKISKIIPEFTDDIIPLQYTGLKDKNNNEIYEGDILDFDEREWGGKFKPEIIQMEHIIGDWNYNGSLIDVSSWRKVIGNIYENPELLK